MKLLNSVPALLVVALVAAPPRIFAGERSDEDHHGAVLEIGAVGEWGLQDGKPSFGPSVAVEVTPIERWLEIEAGISPLRSKDGYAFSRCHDQNLAVNVGLLIALPSR